MQELIDTPCHDGHANRLIKWKRRHPQDLSKVLCRDGMPFDNSHAERLIRLAIIRRKNGHRTRSESGADYRAVKVSVLRTLKQGLRDLIKTTNSATKSYLESGQLPHLPPINTSLG